MVSLSTETAGGGEGDAPAEVAQWLRTDRRRSHQDNHEVGDLLQRRQKRRRRLEIGSAPTGQGFGAMTARLAPATITTAMSVAPLEYNDNTDAAVGESCVSPREDVDMGTPSATNAKVMIAAAWSATVEDKNTRKRQGQDAVWKTDRTSESSCTATRENQLQPRESQTPEPSQQHVQRDVELLEFREYNNADLDCLDILPSQDFDGGKVDDEVDVHPPLATRSAPPDSCAWLDFRDGTQFREDEASEVFDDVIYAPAPPLVQPTQKFSPAPAALRRVQNALNDMYESESELSDGFEVSLSFTPAASRASSPKPSVSATASATKAAPSDPHVETTRPSCRTATPPPSASHSRANNQWRARMSVKRDCSFIDTSDTEKPKSRSCVRVEELSDSGDEFGEKLKLVDRGATHDSRRGIATASSFGSTAAAQTTESSLPTGFCPRKVKRRKVRQLALDGFLTAQPSTL